MSNHPPGLNLRTVKVIEVVRRYRRWTIDIHFRDENAEKFILNSYQFKYQARREAIAVARWQSHNQPFPIQLHVKDRRGVIREHNTYGTDPPETEG